MTPSPCSPRSATRDAGFSLIELLAALTIASLLAFVVNLNLPSTSDRITQTAMAQIATGVSQLRSDALMTQQITGLRLEGNLLHTARWTGSGWQPGSRPAVRLDKACFASVPGRPEADRSPDIIIDATGWISSKNIQLKCGREQPDLIKAEALASQ